MKLLRVQMLRFIAAVAVVAYHARGTYGIYVPFSGLKGLDHGYLGVDLFFVISGFIIQLTVGAREQNWRKFALRRVERVVPLYWLCTGTIFLLLQLPMFTRNTPPTVDYLIRSLGFVAWTKAPQQMPLLYPGWSLEYEMFFYGTVAVALAVTSKPWSWVCSIFAALVVLGAALNVDPATSRLAFFVNPMLIEFCLGVMIALYLETKKPPVHVVAVIAVALIALAFTRSELGVRVLAAGIPCAGIVASAAFLDERHIVRSAFGRLIAHLGDASYSIYLVHILVVSGVCKVIVRLSPEAPAGLVIAAITVAAILLGYVVFRFIERPIASFIRRYHGGTPGKLRGRKTAASVILPGMAGADEQRARDLEAESPLSPSDWAPRQSSGRR